MSVLAEAAKQAERAAIERSATATRPEDIERARYLDRTVTERELLDRCARAVALCGVHATETEREDLASELAQAVARKHDTWRPARRLVSIGYLRGRAAKLAADRTDWRSVFTARGKVRTAIEPLPAPAEDESILACAHEQDAPAINVDAEHVADALALDASGAATVASALSGYGSALEYAKAAGVSAATARKRLERGRDSIRARYPNPAALMGALEDMLSDPADADALTDALAGIMRTANLYRAPAGLEAPDRVDQVEDADVQTVDALDWEAPAPRGAGWAQAPAELPTRVRRFVRVSHGWAVAGTDHSERELAAETGARIWARDYAGDRCCPTWRARSVLAYIDCHTLPA